MSVIGEPTAKRERGKLKFSDLEKMGKSEGKKEEKQEEAETDIQAILNANKEPKWVEKFRTEVVLGSKDPIFMDTYDLAATRYDLVNLKVEFWHQDNLATLGNKKLPKN